MRRLLCLILRGPALVLWVVLLRSVWSFPVWPRSLVVCFGARSKFLLRTLTLHLKALWRGAIVAWWRAGRSRRSERSRRLLLTVWHGLGARCLALDG